MSSQNEDQGGPGRGVILILVVERDPHIKKLERFFLEQAGFGVEFVDNGQEGIECARVLQPRILITEIILPGIDGLAVCRALKSDPQTKHIPVLVFSILAAEERAREAGADAFLRKPLDEVQLLAAVGSMLGESTEETTWTA